MDDHFLVIVSHACEVEVHDFDHYNTAIRFYNSVMSDPDQYNLEIKLVKEITRGVK